MTNTSRLEIYIETTSILYSPTYSFHDTDVPSNLEFILSGPGHHLRQAEVHYSYLWDDSPGEWRSTLDISMLETLAEVATRLERLEISFSREFKIFSGARDGPVIELEEYSWVDEVKEVPCSEWELERADVTMRLTASQIADLVDFVKGMVVDEKQFALVEGAMWHEEYYASGVWEKLVVIEEHKKFFGKEVIDVLKRFGPSLKRIDIRGTVDRKWMRVVAEVTGAVVRGQEAEEEGWVVVGPEDG
jgi:hypothetical protein